MNSMYRKALQLLATRPEIAGNPRAQEMLGILRDGDAQRGEELANNLLGNYGMTREQALARAREFFGF